MFTIIEDEAGRIVENDVNLSTDADIQLKQDENEGKKALNGKIKKKKKADRRKENEIAKKSLEQSGMENEEDDEGELDNEPLLANIQSKLFALPLDKLAELRVKIGTELFEKALYGRNEKMNSKKESQAYHLHSSKRPREELSNRPPPKMRRIKGLEGTRKQQNACFDPRFSAACGQFDEFSFHRDYAFLEEFRQWDIKELKKAYRIAKREQNVAKAERIRQNLLRLENQQKADKDQQLMERLRSELRQENIERMKRGERPIYINNNELKQRFLDRKRHLYFGKNGEIFGKKDELKKNNKDNDKDNEEMEGSEEEGEKAGTSSAFLASTIGLNETIKTDERRRKVRRKR